MRTPLFYLLAISLCCCNNQSDDAAANTSKVSFNEFIDSIRCDSLAATSVVIDNSILKRRADTIFQEFHYNNIKFNFVSVRGTSTEGGCENMFSYYFMVNDKMIAAKAIPDSMRNHGLPMDKLCELTMALNEAETFNHNGIDYLIIPMQTSECIGQFCHTRIDNIFAINKDTVNYMVVDGWQICDVNKDGNLDQIVFNDDAVRMRHWLEKSSQKMPAQNCATIQIWTFKDNTWSLLRDGAGEPYAMLVGFDTLHKRDSYRVLHRNWVPN